MPKYQPPSNKRFLLSLLIDYLFVNALLSIIGSLFSPNLIEFMLRISLFFIIEIIFLNIFHNSPGLYLLNIRMVKETNQKTGKKAFYIMINPDIYSKESKISILIGTFLCSEALRSLSEWSTFGVPSPVFGIIPSKGTFVLISITSGVLLLFISYSFFRLKRIGYWIGVGYFILGLISIVISWSMWDEYIKVFIVSRKAFQGLPVRGNEIRFMQSIFPEAILIIIVLCFLGLISVKRNFSTNKETKNRPC